MASEELNIVSEKPPLPTLWVDTAIVIKLAKITKGEAIADIERQRGIRLKNLVTELARSKKLLCPEGEQEYEYCGVRLEDEIFREFATISRGIRMVPRSSAQDAQIFIAMRAYWNKVMEIRLPYQIYFHNDPIKALDETTKQRFFVSVHGLPPFLLQMGNESRTETYVHSEHLRQKNVARNRTYDEQLAHEQKAFVNSLVGFIRSFRERLQKGEIKWWEFFALEGYSKYITEWYRLGHKWPDWDGLCTFLTSDYFFKLPWVRISSQLYAKLVTDSRPIESGDSMDVKHLSLTIPMVHYILTDRKMANRIISLGIDKEWDTKVFSESTIDELFVELERL
jgi:hypothetical protein